MTISLPKFFQPQLKPTYLPVCLLVSIITTISCSSIQPTPQAKPLVVTTLKKNIDRVLFNSQGTLAIGESEGNQIQLWTIENPKLLRTFKVESASVLDIAFSPDGKQLASTSYAIGSKQTPIEFWDISSSVPSRKLDINPHFASSLVFSPTGEQLISSNLDGIIDFWNVQTSQKERTIKTNLPIRDLAISPDGNILIANGTTSLDLASSYQVIKLWNVKTGKVIRTLQEHQDLVHEVTFSPDGSKIAIAANDFATLWDVKSGKLIHTLKGHLSSVPDDPSDPQDNTITVQLEVQSIAFSPDGKLVATGSQDNTIKIWDVDSGKELYTLRGHSCSVTSVAFSPDGQILVSGGNDKTVKAWKVSDFSLFSATNSPNQPIDCL
jgi:WD40 repeat protein